jgi:hypothetical protein
VKTHGNYVSRCHDGCKPYVIGEGYTKIWPGHIHQWVSRGQIVLVDMITSHSRGDDYVPSKAQVGLRRDTMMWSLMQMMLNATLWLRNELQSLNLCHLYHRIYIFWMLWAQFGHNCCPYHSTPWRWSANSVNGY